MVFPQGGMIHSPDEVREYVIGLEKIGYDHLVIPDHVLGVNPSSHPGWSGPYDVDDRFHELFVLCGFLAAFATIELVPGVLVLPQRQTPLAAKQAAEIDLLSKGHFRLGVGVGWNSPEFEGLGASFVDRGARLDEQIVLMRRLWSEAVVDFDGEFHSLHGVGIAPLPDRTIPIWIGAERASRALKRVGRLGDGWMSMGPPIPETSRSLDIIRVAAEEAGRDPHAIGLQAWVTVGANDLDRAQREASGWRAFGATHIAINTRGDGPRSVSEHLDLAQRAIGLL
ncbi:MAG: LLM class F420-dependent oxidoreductase [Actinomycetota bacterium]|nr:LLM class F420-dependent oxidoreductase [Actinomycetota bacterium]